MKVAARTWAGHEAPFLSVGITAPTDLIVRVGFRVLPILPIVDAKTALPGFGHAQIVLPAQWVWKGLVRVRALKSFWAPGPRLWLPSRHEESIVTARHLRGGRGNGSSRRRRDRCEIRVVPAIGQAVLAASGPGVRHRLDHPLRVARRGRCPGAGPCRAEPGPGGTAPVPALVRRQPRCSTRAGPGVSSERSGRPLGWPR